MANTKRVNKFVYDGLHVPPTLRSKFKGVHHRIRTAHTNNYYLDENIINCESAQKLNLLTHSGCAHRQHANRSKQFCLWLMTTLLPFFA